MRTSTMRVALAAVCGFFLLGSTVVGAAECPGNPDALGTSRTIVVDPAEHPRLGSMQYHESLPLEDHEIVITFDDGPLPPRSSQVLDILAHECVKATYFIIGKMARNFPEMVRRIHEAGHTIGTHSYSHPLTFHRMSLERAQFEINEGIASVASALGDGTGPAPFFRVPGLLRAEGVEHYLNSLNLQVWSADFLADDWLRIGPGQVYSRALQRVEASRKGILLLHDIQARTVEALPYLLRELKRRGYRVVHVVPAAPDRPKTATDPRQWAMHTHQLLPRTPIFIETEPELPAPSPASFGIDVAADSSPSFLNGIPFVQGPARQPSRLLAQGQGLSPPVMTWPHSLEALPDVPSFSGRPQLAAPSPQSLGYSGDKSKPWVARKASIDIVEETGAPVNEIQRLLESLQDEDAPPVDDRNRKSPHLIDPWPMEDVPPGPVPPLHLRGPVINATMPRGAFP
jgi:peptidoglycan/xylan/chitin deacetylase (PgdA/CDA1 family)